jgi:hexosaminidase
LQKPFNTDSISISWEVLSNTSEDLPTSKCIFTIENKGKYEMVGNWQLYFSQSPRKIVNTQSVSNGEVEHISGDWYRIVPKSGLIIKPKEQIKIFYETEYWYIKESDAPSGLYFVYTDNNGEETIYEIQDFTIQNFERPEQVLRHKNDLTPLPTAEEAYKANKDLTIIHPKELLQIVPSPKKITVGSGSVIFTDSLTIYYSNDDLISEAEYLKGEIKRLLGWAINIEKGSNPKNNSVLLSASYSIVNQNEAYNLSVSNRQIISIQGNNEAGVFYGIQSLLALIPIDNIFEKSKKIEIPLVQIDDSPRFSYRGVHIDVARNFKPKETILKTIDILAFYKINTLHLHLTDDEAWRIEIDGLPELTAIGGERGHTNKNANALHPAYGSGASLYRGHYTRNDFIEILKYAKKKHIRVIPEVNMPGHARAAIKAMEARFVHFIEKGDTSLANEFRLIDPLDKSEYLSAQFYNDNVVNVANESVYRFFEKVVDELIDMYKEANAPLEIFHIGGDEVPKGAWVNSPMAKELLNSRPDINQYENLHSYFTERASEVLSKKGLKIAGWEEIALNYNNGQEVNPKFANGSVIPYVWNSLWGAQDLAYRLANRGYPVVMCHVTNFYLDLAYSNHPKEPGLYWGGFVNTKSAWLYNPFNIFQILDKDNLCRTVDIDEEYKSMERLKPNAQKNIIGLQAQLWSETIKSTEMLEYYLLPKLIGFVETAWSKERRWEDTIDKTQREKEIKEDWNIFANTIGQRELPRLSLLFGGYNYRIPSPGVTVENGLLKANVEFPGLDIRYTLDGSEPNRTSQLFEEIIELNDNTVKLRCFDKAGNSSRTVEIKPNGNKSIF